VGVGGILEVGKGRIQCSCWTARVAGSPVNHTSFFQNLTIGVRLSSTTRVRLICCKGWVEQYTVSAVQCAATTQDGLLDLTLLHATLHPTYNVPRLWQAHVQDWIKLDSSVGTASKQLLVRIAHGNVLLLLVLLLLLASCRPCGGSAVAASSSCCCYWFGGGAS